MAYRPQIRIMIFRYYLGPTLHKNPYKQRLIAVSSTCSTTPLSKLLIIISKNTDDLKRCPETIYSRNGVNQIRTFENSEELSKLLKSQTISKILSIKTFVFPTPYTTIPHEQLKSYLSDIISNFICKYGSRKYVVVQNNEYFVKDESDSPNKYLERERLIIQMFD